MPLVVLQGIVVQNVAVPRVAAQRTRTELPLLRGWLFASLLASGLFCWMTPVRGMADEPTGLEVAAALESTLIDAIANSEKSVVAIARVRRGGQFIPERPDTGSPQRAAPGEPGFIPNDYGTGVVLDRNGLILTHYHVLRDESTYYVTTSDRKTYIARVKGADPRSDLAVLEVTAKDLRPIRFGDGSKLKKGQIVIALGNPYAIARDGQASASWGIVANLSRKAGPTPDETSPSGVRNTSLHHYGTLIQTDAKLNLGTSGGALLNLKGEMVGMTTSLAAAVGYEQAAGYAIPVDELFRRAVDALKQGREVEYGYLGIGPRDLRSDEILAGRRGIKVERVVANTAAARHDVKLNDVITHVNGAPLFDVEDLMLKVGRLPNSAIARLTIQNEGQVKNVNVELSKFPVYGKKIVTATDPAWRGVRVDYNTANPTILEPHAAGVMVMDVEDDSPAYAAGLRPDMIITDVGNASVFTPKEFHAAVANKKGDISLRVFGASKPFTIPGGAH